MVICRYFIQGTCRFGDRCWYEHPRENRGPRYNDYRYDNFNNPVVSRYDHFNSPVVSRYDNFNSPPLVSRYDIYNRNNYNGRYTYNSPKYYVAPQPRSTWSDYGVRNVSTQPKNVRNTTGFEANRSINYTESSVKKNFSFRVPPVVNDNVQNVMKNISSKPEVQKSELDHLTPQEIIELISNDAEQWELSKQWPFSTYAYERGGLCLPGFKDISFEELRLEAYDSKRNGTFENYEQHVKDLYNNWKSKIMQLRQPDASVNQSLIEFINNKKNLILSATTPFTSGFMQVSSVDFAPLPQNIPANVTIHISPFDSAGNKMNFGNTEFIVPPQPNNAAVIGNQSVSTLFNTANKNIGIKQGLLQRDNAVTSTNVFGGGFPSMPASTGSPLPSSNFSHPVSSTSIINTNTPLNISRSCLYTPLNELTGIEKEQFEAQCFSLGLIPTRPPPKEMT